MTAITKQGVMAATLAALITGNAAACEVTIMTTINNGPAMTAVQIGIYQGIAKAKEKGVYKGRKPTARAKLEEMKALLSKGLNRSQIARDLGVSIASVHAYLNPVIRGEMAA